MWKKLTKKYNKNNGNKINFNFNNDNRLGEAFKNCCRTSKSVSSFFFFGIFYSCTAFRCFSTMVDLKYDFKRLNIKNVLVFFRTHNPDSSIELPKKFKYKKKINKIELIISFINWQMFFI
jgi:hypothetical protein